MTRAGLLSNSHKVLLGTALFMLLFGKHLGMELEILIFILTPIVYMLDLDANKYVIHYSLPISIKRRLHILYALNIISSFFAVSVVHITYYLEGTNRSIVISLFIFLMNVIGCDLYYYLFCSQEFKKDVLDIDKKQASYQGAVGAIIGVSIAIRMRVGTQSPLEQFILRLGRVGGSILIVCMALFAIWWTWKSRYTFERVIRKGKRGKNIN